MDRKIRQAQIQVLEAFSREAHSFALAGGTALELYYLRHRFSADLDLFSPAYTLKEVKDLISAFEECMKAKAKLGAEFLSSEKAKVRFYHIPVKGSDRPLKIDFVEDVFFTKPKFNKFSGVPVYRAQDIYLQKITAVLGTRTQTDETGRQFMQGRQAARDVFDIYMLSKKIKPLHLFLEDIPAYLQRGMIHWYRTFSRQDLKFELLDLDIYDKKFDSKEMIIYLEKEIEKFAEEVIE